MTQVPNVTASTTNFLLNEPASASAGVDKLIQQINGFSENGVPVTIPGLSSSFGLYIEGTTAVRGNPSVYGPGTIELVLAPTNNDGTPSAPLGIQQRNQAASPFPILPTLRMTSSWPPAAS